MTFFDWMISENLTVNTATRYNAALNQDLSNWAIQSNITNIALNSIKDIVIFNNVSEQIQLLTVFLERNRITHRMYSSALKKYSEYLATKRTTILENDIDLILNEINITSTEKTTLIKARLGQGDFRKKLIDRWSRCAVTGLGNTSLLIASHIKPWRDSSNSERLNEFNGLLLSPNLDKAFDHGYITFESNGNIKISPLFTDFQEMGITAMMKVSLANEHQSFMQHHRESVFKAI